MGINIVNGKKYNLNGDVKGSVTSTSGDIECGDVGGNVETTSGDVKCGKVFGSVKSISGDIKHK